MQDSLLQPTSARPKAKVTFASQLRTLLIRKELQLKLRRPICSLCEILLPIALSGLVVLGALAANEEHFPTTFYAPTTLAAPLVIEIQIWMTPIMEMNEVSHSQYEVARANSPGDM